MFVGSWAATHLGSSSRVWEPEHCSPGLDEVSCRFHLNSVGASRESSAKKISYILPEICLRVGTCSKAVRWRGSGRSGSLK